MAKIERGHNVTTLVKLFDENHLKEWYKYFGEYKIIQETVHKSYSYNYYIIKKKLYDVKGIFYDYLIRKHVYNLKGEDGFDNRCETMKSVKYLYNDHEKDKVHVVDEDNCAGVCIECKTKKKANEYNKILKLSIENYEQYYKNKNYHVMDILPNIYNTALSHKLFFHKNPKEFNKEMLNIENIKDVISYKSCIVYYRYQRFYNKSYLWL